MSRRIGGRATDGQLVDTVEQMLVDTIYWLQRATSRKSTRVTRHKQTLYVLRVEELRVSGVKARRQLAVSMR